MAGPVPTALKYGIPSSTLYNCPTGKLHKPGAGEPTVLTEAIVKEIASPCITLADMSFGLSKILKKLLCLTIYLHDNNIPNSYTGGVPGSIW